MVDLVNELNGKVAVVTGSARNIGRATAEELGRAGAAVVVNARSARELCEEVAQGIVDAGGRALPFIADITDADSVGRMVDAAIAEFGGIDILVNNAANRNTTPFEQMDADNWAGVLAASIDGAFLMSKACVPHLIARGGGSIVSMGGMAAYRGTAGRSHTMTAKSGLQGLARGLAIDLGKHGIRSNMVSVGIFDTEREGSSSVVPTFHDNAEIPLGRRGVPQDVADLIRFLVGPGAGYISGQTIHINGAAHCPP